MANEKTTKAAGARAATVEEIAEAQARMTAGGDEENWAAIPSGQKIFIAGKNLNAVVEGYLVGAEVRESKDFGEFIVYVISATKPGEYNDNNGAKFSVGAGEHISVVVTGALKGPLQGAAVDPDNCVKVRLQPIGYRDIGKGRKFLDFKNDYVAEADGATPKKFPRSSLGLGAMLSTGTPAADRPQLASGDAVS